MFRLFGLLLVGLIFGVGIATQSFASQFESEIVKFHGKYGFSKYAEIKFTNTGLSEPIIFLHSSTGDIPVKVMLVLKSDICTTSLYHDDGSGSSKFKCSSGLELRAKYQCSRSSCLLRGDHHQRGKWSLLFYYHNENIDLAETLRFFNGQASTTQIASSTVSQSDTATTFASDLPACPSDTSAYWNNCFGTYTYDNGDKYVGEYKDDKRNGQGTYTHGPNSKWAGDKYVGEYLSLIHI